MTPGEHGIESVLEAGNDGAYPRRYTFQANVDVPVHRWYRMTAAFGYPLVEDLLDHLPLGKGALVLDPFCGTGTVPVVCQSRGLESIGIELNPFLADLSRLKTSAHQLSLEELESDRARIIRLARKLARGYGELSVGEIGRVVYDGIPPIANIEKWWARGFLKEALALRQAIYETPLTGLERIFFRIAASIILTEHENTRGHVSLSYARIGNNQSAIKYFEVKARAMTRDVGATQGNHKANSAIVCANSTNAHDALKPYLGRRRVDAVITSPPYCNRFTYTRETRAQLYFSGLLKRVSEAGTLDKHAIGGTWGSATHELRSRTLRNPPAVVRQAIGPRLNKLAKRKEKLYHNYVAKFFDDSYRHLRGLRRILKKDAPVVYIVGDSILGGVRIPTDEILVKLMCSTGYDVETRMVFRKRNTKSVHEACIIARRGG